MPFVKLDCGILHSSLWIDHDARTVFLTALLMARPRRLSAAMDALKTRTLEPLGYTVPPGEYGFVEAANVGIVKEAGIPKEDGLAALERLAMTDADSRTPAHEGRRMVRVEGGFVVLNFDAYRRKDHTNAQRQARHRARKAGKTDNAEAVLPDSPPVTSRNAVTPRYITQAEAEAYPSSLRSEVSDEDESSSSPAPQAEAGGDGKGDEAKKAKRAADRAALKAISLKVNPIMRRRDSTEWTPDEKAALKKNRKVFTDENIAVVLRFYRARIPDGAKVYKRTAMLTLVRYFGGEVDKANAFFKIDASKAAAVAEAIPDDWEKFLRTARTDPEFLDVALTWRTWADVPKSWQYLRAEYEKFKSNFTV